MNLTVPHKILAVAQVAEVDPAARPVGAVNTLRWRADGWQGFNTDGHGLESGLGEARTVAGDERALFQFSIEVARLWIRDHLA